MVTKAEFLEALRSGGYEQTEGRLREGSTYCCLGVYCNIAAPDQWKAWTSSFSHYAGSASAIDSRYALRAFGETLGLPETTPLEILFKVQTHLIHMNDGIGDFEGHKHSFAQIADFLEFELDTFVDEILGEVRYTTV